MVNNQRGFTHLEVLLSITIFLLVISFVLSLQGKLFTFAHHNDLREELVLEAANIIEEVKSGTNIEEVDSKFDYTYEVKEETEVYDSIYLLVKHPKNSKYDVEVEHLILKQEVKSHAKAP